MAKLKHTVEDRLVHELSKEIQAEIDKDIQQAILNELLTLEKKEKE